MRLYLLTSQTFVIFFLAQSSLKKLLNTLLLFIFLWAPFPLYNVRLHSRLSKAFDFKSVNPKLQFFFAG